MTCETPNPDGWEPIAAPHGLPIDLVEPCPSHPPVGDYAPRHFFLPEVAWPAPVGPVIRMRPRREHWLLRQPEPPVQPSTDLLEPPEFGRALAASALVWALGALALAVLAAAGVLR